jgi:hypothetical protein
MKKESRCNNMGYGKERYDGKIGNEILEGDTVQCWGGEFCQGFWEHMETLVVSEQTKFIIEECENVKIINRGAKL